MRQLLFILIAFTILSLATPAKAGPFVHSAIAGDPTQPVTVKPPLTNPKQLIEALPLSIAIKHCLTLQDSITEQYKLIDAFNNQPDLDNLPKNISDAGREKIMLYMMGRPDIADFGFLVPDIWMLAERSLRIKWNALITLRLDEALGFRNNGYQFAGNCKGKLIGEITKTDNFTHARIEIPLAFDQTEVTLTYLLYKQDGYNWQIDDLLVNGVGVTHYLDKNLNQKNITDQLKSLCQKSSFGGLKC